MRPSAPSSRGPEQQRLRSLVPGLRGRMERSDRTMTRRLILVAVPASLAAVVCGPSLATPGPPQIRMENASRIKKGMMLAEVEAIVGGLARDEVEARGGDWEGGGGFGGMTYSRQITNALFRQVFTWSYSLRVQREDVIQSRWT